MKENKKMKGLHFFWMILLLVGATALGEGFYAIGFESSNIIMVYILGVLFTAVLTSGLKYTILSSMLSVLSFNFLFTKPMFTFSAYSTGDTITILIMFVVALVSGSLAVKIKRQAEQASAMAYGTKILLETNQLLQQAVGEQGILEATAGQLVKLLERTVVCYGITEGQEVADGVLFPVEAGAEPGQYLSEREKDIAQWMLQNGAYADTETVKFEDTLWKYFAVKGEETIFAVYAIAVLGNPLSAFDTNLLLSILGECGVALEKEVLRKEREEAAAQAKNEGLRSNLLRGISHDLRTPLTSISGNAAVLLKNGASLDEQKRNALYADIYEDALWLIHLVENLLSVTRIENGSMQLHLQTELMEEVIAEAVRHVDRRKTAHTILLEESDEMLLAKMDGRLIMQVVINLVNNAIQYTREGSEIKIITKRVGETIQVSVADNGAGIPDADKEKLFELFYTAGHTISDQGRGMGLGLPLCKSIITAHGGQITIGDNHPHGAVFTFTLQAEEVPVHE